MFRIKSQSVIAKTMLAGTVLFSAATATKPAHAAADTAYAVLQGQSNAVFLADNYAGGHWWNTFQPMVQQLTGIPHIEIRQDTYDSANYNKTVGWTLNSSTSTYSFSDPNLWLNANNQNDASAWPLGPLGTACRDFMANRFSNTPANTPVAFFRFHSEYDSRFTGAEADRYAVANRRFVTLMRQATNLPNVRIPVFYGAPAFGMNIQDQGLRAVRDAWNNDINDSAFEAHWAFGAMYDTDDMNDDWSHSDAAGLQQVAARMAFAYSRWLYNKGYAVNNLSSLPKLGPRINRFDRVSGAANQVDVKVVHDAGTDLVIPSNVALGGFEIYDPGTGNTMNPTGVSKINGTTLRLTLPNNLSSNSGITLDYLKWTIFYGPGTLITDNYQNLSKPSYIQNAINNIYPNLKFPIRRLAHAITIGVTDPAGLDDTPANGSSTPTPTPTPTPAPSANLVTNPGFEAQQYSTSTPSGWSFSQFDANWNSVPATAFYTEGWWGSEGPYAGNYRGSCYSPNAYKIYVYQTKTGLANGNYTLRVQARSGGGQNQCYLEAKDYGGSARQVTFPVTSTWTPVTITNINVSNGQCTIGVWVDANANNWCHMDNFEFFKQ